MDVHKTTANYSRIVTVILMGLVDFRASVSDDYFAAVLHLGEYSAYRVSGRVTF